MNDSNRRWGLFKVQLPPVLGFAYLSANFGLIYASVGGVILALFSTLLLSRWELPTTKKFISIFLCDVVASWCLFEVLPIYIHDNPTFLTYVTGITYMLLWCFIGWLAGIRSQTPEEELRELLDDRACQ